MKIQSRPAAKPGSAIHRMFDILKDAGLPEKYHPFVVATTFEATETGTHICVMVTDASFLKVNHREIHLFLNEK